MGFEWELTTGTGFRLTPDQQRAVLTALEYEVSDAPEQLHQLQRSYATLKYHWDNPRVTPLMRAFAWALFTQYEVTVSFTGEDCTSIDGNDDAYPDADAQLWALLAPIAAEGSTLLCSNSEGDHWRWIIRDGQAIREERLVDLYPSDFAADLTTLGRALMLAHKAELHHAVPELISAAEALARLKATLRGGRA